MKMMAIMETEEEKAVARKVWNSWQAAIAAGEKGSPFGHSFGGLLDYMTDGKNVGTIAADEPCLIYMKSGTKDNPSWEVFNFAQNRHYEVEGDLAGLANTQGGDFPFFN